MDDRLNEEVKNLYANPDFLKVRMLASLLRDYGVEHIVLSPGGRDVPLVRMFEYNEDSFTLHAVTDERSAAYFGLGLAAQLRRPVACVCTSGTAVSNYLPAVTEAYYTGIPLIMITADRYAVFHEQGEDQTIPQYNIFRDVTKKEITIPEGNGAYVMRQTEREIADCILETMHNGFGPVHINIAIEYIMIGADIEQSYWRLLPYKKPLINRVGVFDSEQELYKYVEALKSSNRILVIYGQNPPPTYEQKKDIEDFAAKYNCVILTDYISNLDCAHSIKAYYYMLMSISQEEFDNELAPDIIISVGGKRLMNDPLTQKVRNGSKEIQHWSVSQDGRVKDFYLRLTSVIEMSQNMFFSWFSKQANDIENNEEYYKKWEEWSSDYIFPEIRGFNINYILRDFLPIIPKGSLLHLGVGQSFYHCRRFNMSKDVEVFCNMGTNGIDGCTSTFMGQCAIEKNRLCFLIVGDLSFFYDMNSVWNKELNGNIRILMVNNNGTGLLRSHNLKYISDIHNTKAKEWVEAVGFKYLSASSKEEFDQKLKQFIVDESDKAIFFEIFCEK